MKKNSIFLVLISILVLSNIYFYSKTEKLDYSIKFGTPFESGGVYFNEPLTNRDDAHTLQLALIKSVSTPKPEITDKSPNSTVMISDPRFNNVFYKINLWINNNEVIFGFDNEDNPHYKTTIGHWGKEVIELIEKYKIENSFEG